MRQRRGPGPDPDPESAGVPGPEDCIPNIPTITVSSRDLKIRNSILAAARKKESDENATQGAPVRDHQVASGFQWETIVDFD